MKYCETCGKALAEEEKFCENCGSRIEEIANQHLQNNQETNTLPKNKKKMLPIPIVIIIVLIGIGWVVFDGIKGSQKADEWFADSNSNNNVDLDKIKKENNVDTALDEESTHAEFEEQEVIPPEEQSDIRNYVGSWQDSDNDVYITGGALVEIYSIENDIMLFSVVQISANGNNIVETGTISAKVENNKVSFPYEDSQGNIGEGSIILEVDYISAILKDTHPNPSSTFSIEMNTYLYRTLSSPNREQTYESEEISEYILPNSSNEYLTINDIAGLTKDELRKARNEIFARHGRIFTDANLQTYFESKSWYAGTVEPTLFDQTMASRLSSLEMANVDLIKSEEDMR